MDEIENMDEIKLIKEKIEEVDLAIAELKYEKQDLLDELADLMAEDAIYGL